MCWAGTRGWALGFAMKTLDYVSRAALANEPLCTELRQGGEHGQGAAMG